MTHAIHPSMFQVKESKRKEAQRFMFTNDFIGQASHVIHGAINVSKTLKQAKAN